MTTEFESIGVSTHGTTTPSWSEEEARRIAAEDGVGELTENHWKMIHTLRQHFVQYGALPPMRLACSMNQLAPHCADELFHGADEAWHEAGLPEPGSEVMSYM